MLSGRTILIRLLQSFGCNLRLGSSIMTILGWNGGATVSQPVLRKRDRECPEISGKQVAGEVRIFIGYGKCVKANTIRIIIRRVFSESLWRVSRSNFSSVVVQRLFSSNSPFKLGFQPQITLKENFEAHCIHLVASTLSVATSWAANLVSAWNAAIAEASVENFLLFYVEKPSYGERFRNCSQCVSEWIPHFARSIAFYPVRFSAVSACSL